MYDRPVSGLVVVLGDFQVRAVRRSTRWTSWKAYLSFEPPLLDSPLQSTLLAVSIAEMTPYEERLTRAIFDRLAGRQLCRKKIEEICESIKVADEIIRQNDWLMEAIGAKPIDRPKPKAYHSKRQRGGSMPVATHQGSGQLGEIAFTIQVFKEGQLFVTHAPELDVSSAGKTVEEAKAHLREAVEAFLEEAHRMGTLVDILEEAGYERTSEGWKAPDLLAQERAAVPAPR